MPTSCKKGTILRVAHTRKRGSKKTSVKAKCIKATSQTGKKTSVENKKYLKKRKSLQHQARAKFETPKCKKGSVVREGFRRASKSGKQIWVPPTCVKDVGKKGKQERLFYIEPGRLSKYGYDDIENKSEPSRHMAIRKAFVSGEKPLSVARRLNALSTLTKNTNPQLSNKFKEDSEWVKLTQEYKLERAK